MNNLTPETIDSTSSIGAVWPPEPGSNNRLRGFYPAAAASPAAIAELVATFEDQRQTLADITEDRLAIRAVTTVTGLARLEANGILEAALPLAESNRVIAYLGWNTPERSMSKAALEAHDSALKLAVDPKTPDTRVGLAGYSTGIIDASTDDQARQIYASQFTRLYAAFGYDEEQVRDLLSSPHNTICFLRDGGRIISTAMAETADIEVDGHGTIRIAEVTEAITDPDYRGQRLYKTISGLLVEHMMDDFGLSLDALYGESNLAMPGVLRAAHRNRRRFSYFDRERFGLGAPTFGILQQSFHVADGVEKRRYNDFALSYVPLGS